MSLSFDGLPEIDHRADEIGLEMHFVITIVNSEVDVRVDLNKWDSADFDWIYIRVVDLCGTCLDVFHFATGDGFTLNFDRLVTPDGAVNPIIFRNPTLAQHCTFVKFPAITPDERNAFQKALVTLLSEPALFTALHDLMQASMLAHQGITNCGRVLDGLRKLVAPGVDPKRGWPIFHEIVHVDSAYLQLIFDHAKNTRHGDRTHIPGHIVTEVMARTHNVMNRFIEYRMRGNQPLPLAGFPLLQG